MAAPAFIETIRGYWQKRWVRILVALLVLAGAIYLQYRLANIPLPVDVEKSKPLYTPATAALIKKEELLVDMPVVDKSAGGVPSGVLLSGDGTEFVSVEARFDSAQITKDFIDLLKSDADERSFPSQDRQAIIYSAMPDEDEADKPAESAPTPEKQKTAPCRTSIDVKLPDGAKTVAELYFFQLAPGSDKHRSFEMKVVGSDVVVQLLTRNFPRAETYGEMGGSDCGKTLTIGDWNRSFTAPAPIDIVVPDGASFRFSFTSAEGKTPWTGAGKFYEPFKLVALPLNAQAVKEVKRDASSNSAPAPPAILEARAVSGGPPLVLKYFRVGSEELQLDYAGQAMVQENGKYAVTFSLVDFIKSNPILAGILAMLDAALLEWIRRALFKGNKISD